MPVIQSTGLKSKQSPEFGWNSLHSGMCAISPVSLVNGSTLEHEGTSQPIMAPRYEKNLGNLQ